MARPHTRKDRLHRPMARPVAHQVSGAPGRRWREIRSLACSPRSTPTGGATASTHSATQLHHIHKYLHLAAQLGADPDPLAPQLAVTEPEVESFLKRLGVAPNFAGPFLGLNPGAEYGPAKRWPADKFIAAACLIQEFARGCWLIFGGQADRALAGEIEAGIKRHHNPNHSASPAVINLAGATSLRELCAGLRSCQLLLTNDTGPMHVAAAVGTPVVVPFGSTSPELTGPGLPGDKKHRLLFSRVACAPCFLPVCPIDLRCMQEITVDQVVKAARSCISEQATSKP
jgi:heptosyltransferase II